MKQFLLLTFKTPLNKTLIVKFPVKFGDKLYSDSLTQIENDLNSKVTELIRLEILPIPRPQMKCKYEEFHYNSFKFHNDSSMTLVFYSHLTGTQFHFHCIPEYLFTD